MWFLVLNTRCRHLKYIEQVDVILNWWFCLFVIIIIFVVLKRFGTFFKAHLFEGGAGCRGAFSGITPARKMDTCFILGSRPTNS